MFHSETKKQKNTIRQPTKLVLLGGGAYTGSAWPMIERALYLSEKRAPRVLIVPTPKVNQKIFDETIIKATKLFEATGATVSTLHSFNDIPSYKELLRRIKNSNVIYVPGGCTRHAIDTWKEHGIDKMLLNAIEQGKVMIGISAGTVPWFKKGYTDSEKYETKTSKSWAFEVIDGIGPIDTVVTPHFNSRQTPDQRLRSEDFMAALSQKSQETGMPQYGLGIDNDAGLVVVNDLVSMIASKPSATLHVVRADPNGEVTVTDLNAPRVEVSSEDESVVPDIDNGITWEDFYLQLSEPAKSPRVTASASSKAS